ncbi:hypothetical protein U1Q18_017892 [Sarracenia purpurea var. burkii]
MMKTLRLVKGKGKEKAQPGAKGTSSAEATQASSLPEFISFKSEGELCQVRLEYQGLPARCSFCQAFGHDTKRCKQQTKLKEKSEWVIVGKGKGVASQLSGFPQVNAAPSSSHLPIIQQKDPDQQAVIEVNANQTQHAGDTENIEVSSTQPPQFGGDKPELSSQVAGDRGGSEEFEDLSATAISTEEISEKTPEAATDHSPVVKGSTSSAKSSSSRKKKKKRSSHYY